MTVARPRYHTIVFDSARWEGFVFRPDDIVISTPAKCGTTWTQMICALLIFQTTEFDRPLDIISPWVDMQTRDLASIRADLDAQTHRRFIKSHTPLPGLPQDPNVTYICVGRDPRDVSLSWDNHLENTDVVALFTARANAVGLDDIAEQLAAGPPERPAELVDRFWAWIDDATPPREAMSLAAMLRHLSTFWEVRDAPNVVMLHYDDLQADLEGEMRRLAKRLGIDVAEERWPELVEAATTGCAAAPTPSRPNRRARSGRTTSGSSTGARAASGATCSAKTTSSATSPAFASSPRRISRRGCTPAPRADGSFRYEWRAGATRRAPSREALE